MAINLNSRIYFFSFLFIFAASSSFAQGVIAPENATVRGANWYCNSGYKETAGKCVKVIAPENATVRGANWYCNSGYKQLGETCKAMTAPELAEKKAREAALLREYKLRQLMGVSGDDCETEWDSNARVCVEVDDVRLDCNKNYDGYFRGCNVEIEYDVKTDYQGNDYLDVDVECEASISYKKGSYGTGYESGDDDESHTLYAHGRDSESIEIYFSFSYSYEVYKVSIDDYECEIDSVYKW